MDAVDVAVRHVPGPAAALGRHGVLPGHVLRVRVPVCLQPDLPVRGTALADVHRAGARRGPDPDRTLRLDLERLVELGRRARHAPAHVLRVVGDVQPEHVRHQHPAAACADGEEGEGHRDEHHRPEGPLAAPPAGEQDARDDHAEPDEDDHPRVGLERRHVRLRLLVPRGDPRPLVRDREVQREGVAVPHAVHVQGLGPPDDADVEDLPLVDGEVPGRERDGDELGRFRAARGRPVSVEQFALDGLVGEGSARVDLEGHERVEDHDHDQARARQELETERLAERLRAEPEADQEPHHQDRAPDHPEPLAVGPGRAHAPHELPADHRQRHEQAAADHDAVGLGQPRRGLATRGLDPGFAAQAHPQEQHVRRSGDGPAGRAEHGGVELARDQAHRPEGQEQRERRDQQTHHEGLLDVETRKEIADGVEHLEKPSQVGRS